MTRSRLNFRWQMLHLDHRRIIAAAGWLLVFTIGAKLAAVGKEVAIAARYGTSVEVDDYNLGFTLATWLPTTLYSVICVVLVPTLVRLGHTNDNARQRFLAELNGISVLVAVLASGLLWLSAPWLAEYFGNDHRGASSTLSVMLRNLAMLPALGILVAVHAVRLQAVHDHRYAAAEGIMPLVVMSLCLGWHAGYGLPLIIGTLLGTGLQAWWLSYAATRLEASRPGFAWWPREASWSPVWKSGIAMGLGSVAMSLTLPLDQYFVARLGPGELATFGYANRILAIGMTFAAAVVSRSTLPVFAEGLVASGSNAQVIQRAALWARLMFAGGIVLALFLALLAPRIVALLFERGAFTRADTMAVATALRWGVWQFPFYFAGLVFVSLLAGASRYRLIGVVGVLAIAAKVLLNFALAPRLGLPGIMLAGTLMYVMTAVICFIAVRNSRNR